MIIKQPHNNNNKGSPPNQTKPTNPTTRISDPNNFSIFFLSNNNNKKQIYKYEMTEIPTEAGFQILRSFSPITTGFAFAICSLPISLKSNSHPCCSGYLWAPHSVNPHLHLNPVSPTRFLQFPHLFACVTDPPFSTSTRARDASTATEDDEFSTTGSSGAVVEGEDGWEIRLRASLAEEDCCSVSWRSRKHLEQRF